MTEFQVLSFANKTTTPYNDAFSKAVQVALPNVECSACRQIWGQMNARIPIETPSDHPLRSRKPGPVSLTEFRILQSSVRECLGLAEDIEIDPGTEIGLLNLVCEGTDIEGIEWPFVHDMVVREDVAEYLQKLGLTGFELSPVVYSFKSKTFPRVKCFRLEVTGYCGKVATDPAIQVTYKCDSCGYTNYSVPKTIKSFEIIESSWDGSDIFKLDSPFNGRYFVTPRFAEVLNNANIGRYRLLDIKSFLKESYTDTWEVMLSDDS